MAEGGEDIPFQDFDDANLNDDDDATAETTFSYDDANPVPLVYSPMVDRLIGQRVEITKQMAEEILKRE